MKKLLRKFYMILRNIAWRFLGVTQDKVALLKRLQTLSTSNWVTIGKGSYDNGATVWRWGKTESLSIGKYCSIAYGVQFICGNGHHQPTSVTTSPLINRLFKDQDVIEIQGTKLSRSEWINKLTNSDGPIVVENDVWIGQDAMILSGVTLGTGSIITAGAIVVKDVEPYTIVGGVPAVFLKRRFPLEISNILLNIAWWDWSESEIRERISDFFDVEEFTKKYYSRVDKSSQ